MKKKFLPVLAVVCLILCAALVWLTMYMGQTTNLVEDAGVVTGQQNNTIGYDSDTDVFLIGTRTGGVIAYNNTDKSPLWEVQTDSSQPVTAIKVHAETDLVYAGSDDQHIYIYKISDGSFVGSVLCNGRVMDFDYSSDDTKLAVATKTNEKANIRIVDVATGEMLYNNKYTYGMKAFCLPPMSRA